MVTIYDDYYIEVNKYNNSFGKPITISTSIGGADYSLNFSADAPEQNVFTEANTLKLRIAPTTNITLDMQSGTGGSTQCTAVFERALGKRGGDAYALCPLDPG